MKGYPYREGEELNGMEAATSAGTANVICDESVATGAPSGSTRTERSEGEGWSRAREKRPPKWESTI